MIFFERIFEDILIELNQNQLLSIIILSISISSILSIIQIKLKSLFKELTLVQNRITKELEPSKNLEKKEKHFFIKKVYKKYGYSPLYNILNIVPLGISLLFLLPIYFMFNDFVFAKYYGLNLDEPLTFGYFNLGVLIMTFLSIAFNYIDKSINNQEKKFNYLLYFILLILLYNEKVSLIIFWTIIQITPYFIKPLLLKFKFKLGKFFICLIPYFVISISSFYSFLISVVFLIVLNIIEYKLINKNFYLKQISYLILVLVFYSSILFEFLLYLNNSFQLPVNFTYKTSLGIILILTPIFLLFKSKIFDLTPIILAFSIITFFGRVNSLKNYEFESKEFADVKKSNTPILLIYLDGFQSPKILRDNYDFENHDLLLNYLNSKNWYVIDKINTNENGTWNSMVSTFNYNLTNDSIFINEVRYNSTLFKKDKNFVLTKNTLIRDLKEKNLKIKSFGLTPFNYLYKSKDIEHLFGRKEVFSSLDYYHPKLAIFHNNRIVYSIFSNSILNIVGRLTFFLKARHETFKYFNTKNIKGYDFIYYHFHMPHGPYYFKNEFEPEDLWSFNEKDYLPFLDFTQKKTIELLKSIDYSNLRVILTSDHGDFHWGGIDTTFSAFFGFDEKDIKNIKTVQDIGILINSSY